mgnify:FL=1
MGEYFLWPTYYVIHSIVMQRMRIEPGDHPRCITVPILDVHNLDKGTWFVRTLDIATEIRIRSCLNF